jgi:hypothetical protein
MKKLKSIKGIPLSYIQSVLKIDPSSPSGLTWLPRTNEWNAWNARFANKPAGYKQASPRNEYQYEYWRTCINYNDKATHLKCSRIIFLLHKSYLIKDNIIDHIDGNSLNNNPDNLRESTDSENQQNSKISKRNTSGHKGVCWDKNSRKWRVQISALGKSYHFGLHEKLEDAIKVSIAARKKLHGDFGRIK